MIRGSTFDYSACGREITRKGKGLRWRGGIDVPASQAPMSGGVNFADAVVALSGLSVPRAREFAALSARIRGDRSAPTLTGNRHFWCSDYMVHHRPEFFASVRMFSSRTVNTELINDEGKQSHHLADGCTLIYRDGKEYRDIFPVWDWSKVPGTTAEQMDLLHAGSPTYKTDATFVGGVTDGQYGAAAQDLHRETLRARKAWFLFDYAFVALGAGIACDSERPVVTSVNQCLLRSKPLKHGRSISHDGIDYNPIGEATLQMTASPQTGRWSDIGTGDDTRVTLDVLNLWIDHGIKPHDASYAYLVGVLPDDWSRGGGADRVRILSNTRDLQAVSVSAPQILFAIFWSPGHVDDGHQHYELDHPCLLMTRRRRGRVSISISNPVNEPAEVTVTTNLRLKGPGALSAPNGTVIKVVLPGGAMAGSSVTSEFQVA